MTLVFFKYGLPVLLGYTLFAGISGRLNPLARPHYQEERPSWLLGIWTGLAISLVVGLTLHLAYSNPDSGIGSVIVPGFFLLACLIIPAVIAFIAHYHRADAVPVYEKPSLERAISKDEWQQDSSINTTMDTTHLLDETVAPSTESTEPHTQSEDTHAGTEHSQPFEGDLREKLAMETSLREETEKHLRITRKALSQLEAETRHFSIDKADGIIALEEKLARNIEAATALESDALKEKLRRVEAEQNIAELKQRMVKAKQEIRRGAAARARALSTANKSIAFARQCVQIRTQLESELKETQTTLDNRQKTISSLIRALEKQKRKTQQDVSSMARQLVLHEKQLKARRSLEGVARSVENKLSSRLVKKVAKAKPLESGMDRGENG